MAAATLVLDSDTRPLPQGRVTYEEFLDWCDEDTWAEWVDGEIEMVSPASLEHQDLDLFLARLLAEFVESRDLGKIITAPFQMRLRELRRGREPDLLFVANENLHRLERTYLDGPADLVVEIVSHESLARDRGNKFIEYEAGGVREYWLIDPQREQAEFYLLGRDQRYHSIFVGEDGIFRSHVLEGFWLKVAWLWYKPLPRVATLLKEMDIL